MLPRREAARERDSEVQVCCGEFTGTSHRPAVVYFQRCCCTWGTFAMQSKGGAGSSGLASTRLMPSAPEGGDWAARGQNCAREVAHAGL